MGGSGGGPEVFPGGRVPIHGALPVGGLGLLPGHGLGDAGRRGGEPPRDVADIAPELGVPPREAIPVHGVVPDGHGAGPLPERPEGLLAEEGA